MRQKAEGEPTKFYTVLEVVKYNKSKIMFFGRVKGNIKDKVVRKFSDTDE